MRKYKQFQAAVMAALLTAFLAVPAYAGPSGAADNSELSATLKDDKLEYDEIGDLIENYNTEYKKLKTQMLSSQSLDAAKDLAAEASDLMEDAKDIKSDDMDKETRELYESYKESARNLRKQAQKMTNADMPKYAEKALRQMKANLTKTVQNLVIQYHEMAAKQELLAKQVELSKAQVDAAGRMAAEGMKTQEDLLAAQEALKQAENGAAELNAGIQNIRQNILILTGWGYDDQAEICAVPEPDLSRIDAMNLEEDKQSAIWANYELQEIKNTSAKGAYVRSNKKRSVSMTEQSVASQMESLYAGIISKRQAYEAALSEFEAASQTMESANTKNTLGMLGNLEYLGAQAAFLNSKSNRATASLELYKAIETYDWAVKGLIVQSGGEN